MDRVEPYHDIVKRILREYAAFDPGGGDVEAETIFDDERGHYELLYTGWKEWRRVHGTVIHVDIRNGKIWIQHDGTQDGVAPQLVAAGIPPEQIVLAFQHPSRRKHTPYAIG